jgi:hypothetical protein
MTGHRTLLSGAIAIGLVVSLPAGATAQSAPPRVLQLAFEADGTVSLAAQNVTVRDVLAEWARLCGCYVVNADRLASAPFPVPVEFRRASQRQVLESLLRQAAGYVLTPRRPNSTGASLYETVYVLATSNPTSVPSAYSAYSPPVAVPLLTPGSPADEIPPVQPLVPQPIPGPVPPPTPPQPSAPRPATVGVPAPMIIVPIGPATPQPSGAPGTVRPAN